MNTNENKNTDLVDEIHETISTLLLMPESFSKNAEVIEAQFFTLFTLVAPHKFDISDIDAGEMLTQYVRQYTGDDNLALHKKYDLTQVAALLTKFYTNVIRNFSSDKNDDSIMN